MRSLLVINFILLLFNISNSQDVSTELKLNHKDSLFIHIDKSKDHYDSKIIEKMYIKQISENLKPFNFHVVICSYKTDKQYGSFVVLYKSDNFMLQRISKDYIDLDIEGRLCTDLRITFADYNNDKYKDFCISFAAEYSGNTCYNLFYVYDIITNEYKECSYLNKMFYDVCIFYDQNKNEFFEGGTSGPIGGYSNIYHWNGTTYELYAKEESHAEGDNLIFTREELNNKRWNVVRRDTTSLH